VSETIVHMPANATPPARILGAWERTDETLDLALAIVLHDAFFADWKPAARRARLLHGST
jgi:hypothetical protein